MDGGAGPCSLELNVIGADSKPVYAATIKVHIAYGFGGIRRLDLEAGTNSEGKVKFTGLPARVHQPPLEFRASKDEFEGVAAYDPSTECQAKHNITLEKSKAQEGHCILCPAKKKFAIQLLLRVNLPVQYAGPEIRPRLPQRFNSECTSAVAIIAGKDSWGHYFPIAVRT